MPTRALLLDVERAAVLDRQRADQERQRMDQERMEAERLELERQCEVQERGRSVELERQRVERESTQKDRAVERGTMLDANAAVWVPAHIDEAEQVQHASTEAGKLLERIQAAWGDDGARHREAEIDRQEQETAMWRQRGERGTQGNAGRSHTGRGRANRTELRQSGSPMTTALSRRDSGWSF